MASKLSVKERRVVALTEGWLQGEHTYQFGGGKNTQNDNPRYTQNQILASTIPENWERFQAYRNRRLYDEEFARGATHSPDLLRRTGQAVLKCAAASREAYIWAKISEGQDFNEANENSWKALDTYKDRLSKGTMRLPNAVLLGPAYPPEKAIAAYSDKPNAYRLPLVTFIAMTGLAMTAVIEQTTHSGRNIAFPQPGLPSGEIESWEFNQNYLRQITKA